MKTMMAVAAFALAFANVQAKPQPTGTLIVYRPGAYAGILRTYSFSIDNGPRHRLKNGCYMRFELPVGDHIMGRPFDITLNLGQTAKGSMSAQARRCTSNM